MASSSATFEDRASVVRRALRDHEAARGAVRTQLAFVRALLDEMRRHAADAARVHGLALQLEDEVARLAALVDDAPPTPPPSGARLRA